MSEQIYWIAPDGTTINLTDLDNGYLVLPGRQGVGLPPVQLQVDTVPLQAGARLRTVRLEDRTLDLPLLIRADTPAQLRQRIRALRFAMDPRRGDGRLRVVYSDESPARELVCRYVSGLEGDESEERAWLTWQKVTLVFRAPDPFWYSATPVEIVATKSAVQGAFFPFFPLRVLSAELLTDIVVTNNGDAEAWPVWTILGPATQVTLLNLTTGAELTLVYTLAAGQMATIDTRPGEKSVLLADGTSIFGSLTTTSALWEIPPGAHSLRLEMNDASTDSRITLRFTERYLGA